MKFQKYDDLPELVKQYLYYIVTIKNRSKKTAYAYSVDLRNFLKFCKLHKTSIGSQVNFNEISVKDIDLNILKQITLTDIYEYLNFVMVKNKNAVKARARKISAIRSFFKYLTFNLKLLNENPTKNLELPAIPKTLPKYLSMEESVNLLKTQAQVKSKTRFRDYCILTLFLNCGMRLSELEGINLKDIKMQEGSLKLLGKGNKERIVYLNESCKKAIVNYLEKERNKLNHIKDNEALFLAIRTKTRLGARYIQKIVEIALNNAGLSNKGYSPHKLRHTAATLLYQYGKVDILILKELLGHSNVGTTEIYTHISNDLLKEAIIKNPLSHEKLKED